MADKYLDEEIVDLIVDQIMRDVDMLVEFWTDHGGRPIFTVELNAAEKLARYNDPELRHQIMAQITGADGEQGLNKYIQELSGLKEQRKVGQLDMPTLGSLPHSLLNT